MREPSELLSRVRRILASGGGRSRAAAAGAALTLAVLGGVVHVANAGPTLTSAEREALDPAVTASLATSYGAAMRQVPHDAAFLRASLGQTVARKRSAVLAIGMAHAAPEADVRKALDALEAAAPGDAARYGKAVDNVYDPLAKAHPEEAAWIDALKVERGAERQSAIEALTLHEEESAAHDGDEPATPSFR